MGRSQKKRQYIYTSKPEGNKIFCRKITQIRCQNPRGKMREAWGNWYNGKTWAKHHWFDVRKGIRSGKCYTRSNQTPLCRKQRQEPSKNASYIGRCTLKYATPVAYPGSSQGEAKYLRFQYFWLIYFYTSYRLPPLLFLYHRSNMILRHDHYITSNPCSLFSKHHRMRASSPKKLGGEMVCGAFAAVIFRHREFSPWEFSPPGIFAAGNFHWQEFSESKKFSDLRPETAPQG